MTSPAPIEPTDYERACLAGHYLSQLETDGHQALVLGEMPLETSVWLDDNRTTIVRLLYTDMATDLGQLMGAIREDAFQDSIEEIGFEVSSGRLLIFDSATDYGDGSNIDALRFVVMRGKYQVLTISAKPNDRTSLVSHRFVLVS